MYLLVLHYTVLYLFVTRITISTFSIVQLSINNYLQHQHLFLLVWFGTWLRTVLNSTSSFPDQIWLIMGGFGPILAPYWP